MEKWLERTALLFSEEKIEKLQKAHVLIVGLGGIGSFAGEFIARAGVGTMTIIDGDVFDPTNKNRQLTAMDSTIGENKAVVLAERLKDINPNYVMVCIDSVTPKLEWIIACKRLKIKIITHLGAGGKIDPSKVKVSKLENTHNCKLGSHIKKRMKRKDISLRGVKAVFSEELQRKESLKMTDGSNFKKSFYGTCSYMPALFGLMGAAEVIRFLCED
jgi:tRNA A37 threonylcarbamoyladenosine dehydratase